MSQSLEFWEFNLTCPFLNSSAGGSSICGETVEITAPSSDKIAINGRRDMLMEKRSERSGLYIMLLVGFL